MMMKRPYISTATMTREDWLVARTAGFGGSDAAAVVGVSPWSSPLTVYLDKIGELPEKEENEAMKQGNMFEEAVAKRFEEETGLKVRKCLKMFEHPQYFWMLANIDRKVVVKGEFVGLEIKTTSAFNKTDFEAGEVQSNYFWQCQHYMAVTGAKHWYLAVCVLGQQFHVFDIPRDEAAVERLIQAESDLWNNHIVPRRPPLPTGMDCDDSAVEVITAQAVRRETADLSPLYSTMEELHMLKAEKKALDKRISEAEQNLKLGIGGAESGVCGRWRISYKDEVKTTIDGKALKAALPDVYNAYSKQSTSRVLRIREV